ncbi:MAG: BON domain-containing protein [Elusimicrobiota bacterium]
MNFRFAVLLSIFVGFSMPLTTGCIRQMKRVDMSDAAIRARVKNELKQRPELETDLMSISVHNRTVYLSGMILTYAMKRQITPIVRGVQGVQAVVNNLVPQE